MSLDIMIQHYVYKSVHIFLEEYQVRHKGKSVALEQKFADGLICVVVVWDLHNRMNEDRCANGQIGM